MLLTTPFVSLVCGMISIQVSVEVLCGDVSVLQLDCSIVFAPSLGVFLWQRLPGDKTCSSRGDFFTVCFLGNNLDNLLGDAGGCNLDLPGGFYKTVNHFVN